jgi:iron complex transport system ATP-binding protein
MDTPLLSVEEVTYRYPGAEWRLLPASLSVAPREILAVLGPNGSGKSTLLKLAAGVLKPDEGQVFLAGQDLRLFKRRQTAKVLGYLPQDAESRFDYSVEEVVAMGRFAHLGGGLAFLRAYDLEVIARSLKQTETDRFRHRHLSRLSGGERQRVLLASVIAQEPQVLLLDEPTTALDVHHQMRFFSILTDLVQHGLAVVVVTHDLNLASLFSHRILLLKEGRIHCEGTPKAVLTKKVLGEVYGDGVEVILHPTLGCPVVLPTTSTLQETEGKS